LALRKAFLVFMVGMLLNLLLLGGIQPATAGSFGDPFPVNTTTTNNQEYPAIAMNGDGNFVVCWQDYSSGNGEVKAQRYSYPYTAQGAETTVASSVGFNEYAPDVAMDSSGNFAVCWQDYSVGNGDTKVQRYNSSGVAQGTEITVVSGAGNQGWPAIAMDSSGDFVVVWQDDAGVGSDIKAQRYDSSGVAQGTEITVVSDAGNQISPDVAMDSSGNFVVVWQDNASGGDVKAQRYDSSGVAQGLAMDAASGAGIQAFPAIAMAASGNFLIAWADNAAGNYDIKARKYSSSGDASGSAITVASGTGTQSNPAIDTDSFGSFTVAWEDNASGNYDIKSRRYNSSGTALGSAATVNTYTTSDQQISAVAMDNNGGSVIAWHSDAQDGSGNGVYAQRYSNVSTTWYFAEGYTGTGFEEWLTLQNPTSVSATVTITYMYRGGGTSVKTKTVAANSRETVDVNADAGSNKEVSIKVESDQPIVAERPMYYNYQNKWQGGHNTIGATSTSATWFFAEGYTGSGFEEWLTLQNPNATAADVMVYYFFRGGSELSIKFKTLAANSRETIDVNADAGTNKEVSTMVLSSQPIIAERPMYFNYQNKWQGGHNTIGATAPDTDWYFAEGYTGSGFENWLTLMNPNSNEVTATITYTFRGGGTPQTRTLTIPKLSRETINVNTDVGADREVSIKVEANDDIVAERPIYFNYQNKWQGGDNTIGVTTPVNQWYLAEGYTGPGFEEWLTLQNPNSDAATVTITYMYRGGGTSVKTKTVAGDSRETVDVNADAGSNKEVSIRVDSTQPIVVERPMYFNYQSKWQGGHNTIGYGP